MKRQANMVTSKVNNHPTKVCNESKGDRNLKCFAPRMMIWSEIFSLLVITEPNWG
jgi:hypothetical protein